MSTTHHPKEVFNKYFPEVAVDYCFGLWLKYNFHFKVTKKRASKLGDYRYEPSEKSHTITVNADLNPFSFLVTYLHEVAHMLVTLNHARNNIDPHGQEWKSEFKKVAQPMLNAAVFPPQVLVALNKYFQNPKASSCSDHNLSKALHQHDSEPSGLYLSDISIGKVFEFQQRHFVKEELRRTRILCKEVSSGRKYLISKLAKVSIVP